MKIYRTGNKKTYIVNKKTGEIYFCLPTLKMEVKTWQKGQSIQV